MNSIRSREDLEKLNELISLESQVKAVRVQNTMRKQNFHEDMKKVFEPVTKPIKDFSEVMTKTLMLTSKENNKTLENLNDRRFEIMNNRGIMASYFLTTFSKNTNPENASQFELVKDSNAHRANDLLKDNTKPVILYDNLLTFRVTVKKIELKDLSNVITNIIYNVDLASFSDKKLMYDFAKERFFDEKAQGNKNSRDTSLIGLLRSPNIMVFASSVSKKLFSKTRILSSHPNEFCDRRMLLKQEKQAVKISTKIDEKIIALADKLLQYKRICKKLQRFSPKYCLK